MKQLDDLQVLTQSIGEYTLDLIGRESLNALQVEMDSRTRDATVTFVLKNPSNEEQLRAIGKFLEVDEIFWGDAVLHFAFASSPDDFSRSHSGAVEYCYA